MLGALVPNIEYMRRSTLPLKLGFCSLLFVLAIAALAMVGTLPGRTRGLGLITESLLRDLHMDRVTYATVNLWGTLIGAAFCLPCGRLLDRFGSRAVIVAVLAGLGGTVLAMSHIISATGLW